MTLRAAFSRIRAHFSAAQHDARLAEEIAGHIDALAVDHQHAGLTPEAARHAARTATSATSLPPRRIAGHTALFRSSKPSRGVPTGPNLLPSLANFVGQPILAAAGFQPALFAQRNAARPSIS